MFQPQKEIHNHTLTLLMDQRNSLLLLIAPVLLTILAFPCASVLAITEFVSESEGVKTYWNVGDPVGKVENNPVNITIDDVTLPPNGYLTVLGDVENGLSRSIDNVQVTGTFYDAHNNVLGTASDWTGITVDDPQTFEPGDISPFWLELYNDAVNISEIATYELRVSWQESQD